MKTKNLSVKIVSTILLISICLMCCSKNEENDIITNSPPEAFSLIGVTNNALNVDVLPSFTWETSTDVDGDAVSYDLYLDTEPDPTTLYAENLTNTSYTVTERLGLDSKYYWKVMAKDNKGGIISSDTFTFYTRNLNIPDKAFREVNMSQYNLLSGHESIVFKNKLWIIGKTERSKSFIWYSEDNGETWKSSSANIPFKARTAFSLVVFKNKLWLIGGSGATSSIGMLNDVWYTENGNEWHEATSNAPFSKRYGHQSFVFNDKIWVVGGYAYATGGHRNDIWSSNDGIGWIEETSNAEFSKRNGFSINIFNNKIWLIGGGSNEGALNDVWQSENGINWKKINTKTIFSKRSGFSAIVYDNKLWVFGGVSQNDGLRNDIWYSSDGVSWKARTSKAPFSPRVNHTLNIFDNKIYMIGGWTDPSNSNEIWVFD
ncbi:Kelch repeat-containing protein [Gelatiniphilus marinus]|uniref:Kelch repeat-containing protein n=1 Tax=Gelatiniphilus marinus TaxID=1759464 RepID=A0ABW5JP05_9FLAO